MSTASTESLSPLVNSSMIPRYIGKRVRLPCKVLSVNTQANRATVQASDGGDVQVQLFSDHDGSTFVEVVGTVEDETTIKNACLISLGDELDMSTVDQTIKIIHQAQFKDVFFPDLP